MTIIKNVTAGLACSVVFSASITLGDDLLRTSKEDPMVKEKLEGVSGEPGDYSLRVAENIIGEWKVTPLVSESLARNPDMELQFLQFRTNGVVEVSYKLTGDAKQFIGLYDVIHKAPQGRGNPPYIAIKSRDSQDEHIHVFVDVRIGTFNFFHLILPYYGLKT